MSHIWVRKQLMVLCMGTYSLLYPSYGKLYVTLGKRRRRASNRLEPGGSERMGVELLRFPPRRSGQIWLAAPDCKSGFSLRTLGVRLPRPAPVWIIGLWEQIEEKTFHLNAGTAVCLEDVMGTFFVATIREQRTLSCFIKTTTYSSHAAPLHGRR